MEFPIILIDLNEIYWIAIKNVWKFLKSFVKIPEGVIKIFFAQSHEGVGEKIKK